MQQIYRRTPMPKCDFNKIAKFYAHSSNFETNIKLTADTLQNVIYVMPSKMLS